MRPTADEEEPENSEDDLSELDPKAWVKALEDAYLICKSSSYNSPTPHERKRSDGARRAGTCRSLWYDRKSVPCTGARSTRWLDSSNNA